MYQHPDVAFYTPRPYVKRQITGLRYAQKTPYEMIDVFLPEEGNGPFPAVIDVHGGGFYYGSRSSARMEPVLGLIHRGYAVVTFDYTLSPNGKFPLQVQELKAAIRYLRANAKDLHIDAAHIGLWGLSAGAYLAAMAAVSQDAPALDAPEMGNAGFSSAVQAVVELYGPTDLSTEAGSSEGDDPAQSVYGVFFGADPAAIPRTVAASDPCRYVSPKAPPFFMQYGTADKLVSPQNGYRLRDCLLQNIGPQKVFFEMIPGAEHADDLFRTSENTQKIYDFLDQWLKNNQAAAGETAAAKKTVPQKEQTGGQS